MDCDTRLALRTENSISINCNSFQYMLNCNMHNTSTHFTLKAYDIVWPCLLEPMLKALRDIAIVASLPSTVFNSVCRSDFCDSTTIVTVSVTYWTSVSTTHQHTSLPKAFDIVWHCLLEPFKAPRDIAIVASLPSPVFHNVCRIDFQVIPILFGVSHLQNFRMDWAH
jgi:hypothetical protein